MTCSVLNSNVVWRAGLERWTFYFVERALTPSPVAFNFVNFAGMTFFTFTCHFVEKSVQRDSKV